MKLYFILVLISLSSCSLFPEPEEQAIERFTLDSLPPNSFNGGGYHTFPSIIIERPFVSSPLDNSRIAVKPTDHTIDYIAGVEWAERLGTLIYESLISSFQNSNRFGTVDRLSDDGNAKLLLAIDVRKFYKRDATHMAEVEYFAHLYHIHNRSNVASNAFYTEIPLSKTPSIADVALALNQAHKKTVISIINWVLKNSEVGKAY